ncbi:MAG: FAD-dependent oxidoreductase [Marinilabiliales bacterium]|nr:FAD-dependent oxidoreductase [Marinilabiliales bacterium]
MDPGGAEAEALKEAKAKRPPLLPLVYQERARAIRTWPLPVTEFPDRQTASRFIHPSPRIQENSRGKVGGSPSTTSQAPFDQPDRLSPHPGIAVGDYPVDHHHSAYAGSECSLPDLKASILYPSPGLPLGTLIPRETVG